MSDYTRVDWQALNGARKKLRQLTIQLEKGERPPNDMLHPADGFHGRVITAYPHNKEPRLAA